jgi:arylsulfatase A-like enzyme
MGMQQRPNILFITSDQQHWNTLGIDNPEIHTPNLDRLARQGMLFERAYCPNPTCTPTRASLLTGQYPSQHGAYALGTKLLEDRPTVNDTWHAHGYRTGLVGKAHFQPLHGSDEFPSLESYPTLQDLEFWKSFTGPFYGFDDFELARNHTDEAHVGQHYALWMEQKGLANWRDYFSKPTGALEPQEHKWNLPEEFHYNTWIAERANHLLEKYRDAGQPFFLWASFFDPHPSYLVPEPWDTMYDPASLTVPERRPGEHDGESPFLRLTADPEGSQEKYGIKGKWMHGVHPHVRDRADLAKDIAVYYGMVSCMDKYIGRILDRLDELGLAENTLVVFTSDHGHYYGHHGLIAKGPFHYEDGVRVPMIARWPGKVAANTRSRAIQSLVDFPVTFLAAAGIGRPRHMSGLDQLPVWTGQQERVRDHALVENTHDPDQAVLRTYVDDRYKLTVYQSFGCGEFFDLREDPGENHNRWSDPDYAEARSRVMHRFLQAEMKKDVLPMPRTWGA